MTSSFLFTWLVHSALASTVLLTCCAVAVMVWRQPADRLRLIQGSLGATLLALVLVSIPSFSALSLGVLKSSESGVGTSPAPALNSSATFVDPAAAMVNDTTAGERFPNPSPANVISQPAAARRPTPLREVDFTVLAIRAICLAYIGGMLVFLLRWAMARIRLHRILRNARAVPAAVRAELTRIAKVDSKHVSLLTSDDVAAPIMCGTRRPVIVLPSDVLYDDKTQLRYYLAHEWAHVNRHDFVTWQLATLLQFFLYYQPVFWWLRRRLATSMDQLADAAASDQGASTIDYATFLVQFAKRQLAPAPRFTLSIHDKQSRLLQRVVFLLDATSPPRPVCPRRASFLIGASAIALGVLVSAVRLDAGPGEAKSTAQKSGPTNGEGQPQPAKDASKVIKAESITYTGQATDHKTGKPISGVKISVIRKLSRDPQTGQWRTLETTEHETDADGRYSFVVPPEQAAEDSLYLEVEAHHPNFASHGRSGYSHAMIRKNLVLGEQPFYSKIELWPGEAITGKVVSPDGEPLPDVEISMYSASDQSKSFPRGSFDKTTTDATGVFRIVPPTGGDGVVWIKPAKYSPQAHRIGDHRGDWGTLTMQKGTTVSGHVLDVKGAPVAGVRIEARRKGDGEKPDEFLNNNAVANQIGRETVSGAAGEFTLLSLPEGDYDLRVERDTDSYDPQPLPQVFLRQKMSIREGATPGEVEIRAVPHVVIQATVLDSAGKPRTGFQLTMFGRMDGGFYAEESSTPGRDGKLEVKAPHGLQQVELDLITNEHSSLRWRMSHDAPLHNGRRVKLGTLEDDISGIEIIRYTAPILLIKPVDEQGAPLEDCVPIVKYKRSDQDKDEMTVYTTGSNVSFEHQNDGRWRSSQALPDEPMTVSVEKTGYTTTPQDASLAEGQERELVFVVTKNPEGK